MVIYRDPFERQDVFHERIPCEQNDWRRVGAALASAARHPPHNHRPVLLGHREEAVRIFLPAEHFAPSNA